MMGAPETHAANAIRLISPEGEETKTLPIGWSWEFFFFGWIFGVPLFRKRLYGMGLLIALILCALLAARYYAIPPSGAEADRVAEEIIAALPRGASEDEIWAATWAHPAMIRATFALIAQFVLMLALMGAHIWTSFRGNLWAARALLQKGWRFADPESQAVWRELHPERPRQAQH